MIMRFATVKLGGRFERKRSLPPDSAGALVAPSPVPVTGVPAFCETSSPNAPSDMLPRYYWTTRDAQLDTIKGVAAQSHGVSIASRNSGDCEYFGEWFVEVDGDAVVVGEDGSI